MRTRAAATRGTPRGTAPGSHRGATGKILLAALLLLGAAGTTWALEEDYVIGVEDTLRISMPDHPELSVDVPVRPDGRISLPLVDDVRAAGLTPLGLKESLEAAYRPFVMVPNISVLVTGVNSRKVYVLGQVETPGMYPVVSRTRILQAIALAGGFTEFAKEDKVILLRDVGEKQERLEINLKRVYRGQDVEANLVLLPGDTVIVP